MAIVTKKENKLKAFVVEHKEEILGTAYAIGAYAVGIGVGYLIFGPTNKEMRKFFKAATRDVIGYNFTADEAKTVAEIFGESATPENLNRLGIQATDKVAGVMLSIAKSET